MKSKITTMHDMFFASEATTVYARTKADANIFNDYNITLSELTFVVK